MGEYCLKNGNELLLKKKYKGKIITLYMKVEEQYHLDSSSLFITAKEISLAAVAAITKQLTKPIIMKERY